MVKLHIVIALQEIFTRLNSPYGGRAEQKTQGARVEILQMEIILGEDLTRRGCRGRLAGFSFFFFAYDTVETTCRLLNVLP